MACMIAAPTVLGGCAASEDAICEVVGREGKLLTSIDNVLSIAISPEALDESVEVCIAQSREAPQVAGPAYRVKPSIPLNYAATVTYRHALPGDTSEINIGRIDGDDFASGAGGWTSMDDCRVQRSDRLVRCSDTELAAYYGLLDGLQGNTADSNADTAGTSGASAADTGQVTLTTTMSMTTDPTNTTDPSDDTNAEETDPTDPTGNSIDYPPECDDLAQGPFTAEDLGALFVTDDTSSPPLGPEDMAMDGDGGFVARSGTSLRRYTLGSPPVLDNGFSPPTFAGPTLGLRYAPNGDLVMMQRTNGRVEVMHPDNTVETLFMQQANSVPNGLFVDADGIVWTTFFTTSRVMRLDPAGEDPAAVVTMQGSPNGVIFDPLRSVLFFLFYSDGVQPSQLLRIPIAADGTAAGASAVVTDMDGFSDGLAIDVCGNMYVVDQGGAGNLIDPNTSRVDRVFMNDAGEVDSIEEILVIEEDDDGNGAEISNLVWGDGEFSTTAYMIGLRGRVYSTDLQIGGAPAGSTPMR
jgi:sugar lactone lactonase YvrE